MGKCVIGRQPTLPLHQSEPLNATILPALRVPKMLNHYMLKMTTAMFAKMLIKVQHLTQLIPNSQTFTLNSSHKTKGQELVILHKCTCTL